MAKTAWISATVATALTAAAFVFNPPAEVHREQIKRAINERNELAGALGLGRLAAFASTYHPMGLLSYTTVDGKVLSIGFMGMVFVMQSSKGS